MRNFFNTNQRPLLVISALASLVSTPLVFAENDTTPEFPWVAFIFFFGIIGLYVLQKISDGKTAKTQKAQAIEADAKHAKFLADVETRIQSLISAHIVTLAIKESQTVHQDEYGNYKVEKWVQEIDYFIDNVLRKDPLISSFMYDKLIESFETAGIESHFDESRRERYEKLRQMVTDAVYAYRVQELENGSILSDDIERMSPIQFEHFCAEVLRRNGWDARATQASGDQGIDVIATLGNVKAVFQCKKYSQPVGNAAVQEIIAGKQFEQADVAGVISNAPYTPSAKQLANATGTYLLHYSELDMFTEKIGVA